MDLREPPGRQELGRRIQAAVMGAGYASLTAFAEELGCSRALIYQYVNGTVLVQLDRLESIAELTGKSLEWFLQAEPGATAAEVSQLQEQLAAASDRVAELESRLAEERGARLRERDEHAGAVLGLLREQCQAQRKAGDALALLEAARRWLALARAQSDQRAMMAALVQIGHALYETGQMQEAREALTEALTLADALADERAAHSIRQELVRVLQASGHLAEARQEATNLLAAEGWWARWSSRASLAALAEQVGDLAEAERWLDEAEGVVEEKGTPDEQRPLARAYLLSNRTSIALARGRYAEALKLNARLRALAEQASLPDQMREAALNEALCRLRLGELDEAGERLRHLHEWAIGSADQRMVALAAIFESERLRRNGDSAAAKRLARQAVDEANGGRSGQVLAEAELALGEAFLAEGRPDDAAYYLQRCARRAETLQYRKLTLTAQLALARARLAEGTTDAEQELTQLAEQASALGYEDLHRDAAGILSAAPEPRKGAST